MRRPSRVASAKEVAWHLLTGAALGLTLALALLAGNKQLAATYAIHPSPQLFLLGLILFSSSTIAVGSGITGFILSRLEKN
jgi:hypothetical protein